MPNLKKQTIRNEIEIHLRFCSFEPAVSKHSSVMDGRLHLPLPYQFYTGEPTHFAYPGEMTRLSCQERATRLEAANVLMITSLFLVLAGPDARQVGLQSVERDDAARDMRQKTTKSRSVDKTVFRQFQN